MTVPFLGCNVSDVRWSVAMLQKKSRIEMRKDKRGIISLMEDIKLSKTNSQIKSIGFNRTVSWGFTSVKLGIYFFKQWSDQMEENWYLSHHWSRLHQFQCSCSVLHTLRNKAVQGCGCDFLPFQSVLRAPNLHHVSAGNTYALDPWKKTRLVSQRLK